MHIKARVFQVIECKAKKRINTLKAKQMHVFSFVFSSRLKMILEWNTISRLPNIHYKEKKPKDL